MFSSKAPENRMAPLAGNADGLQSQVIDWLRFPLAVAVVFIHSLGTLPLDDVSVMQADPLSGMSLYNWLRIFGSHVVTHIAVPTFFVISGFLFFRNMQRWDVRAYRKKLKSRFRSLLVPYLCWNALAFLWIVVLKLAAFVVKGKPLSNILLFLQEHGGIWGLFWDGTVGKGRPS